MGNNQIAMGNNQIAMGNNQIAMGNNQIAMGNNQIANGICPSPSGEVRWGLDDSMQSNNYCSPTAQNYK